MNLIVEQLRLIFADSPQAVASFAGEQPVSAVALFTRKHLPLLVLFPLFSFAAPVRWILAGQFSLSRDALGPLLLAGGFLGMAMVFDKILENERGPELHPRHVLPRNLALFLHLPVSAAGVFFLFHGMIGLLFLLASGAFATALSILTACRLRGLSPARGLALYLSAAVFLLLPLVILFFALNLARTYGIIRFLYF